MKGLPERIWAFEDEDGGIPRSGLWIDEQSEAPSGSPEYVRADCITALKAQVAAADRLSRCLNAFDAAVFNDNGDVTISLGHITISDWMILSRHLAEYRAIRGGKS